MQNRQSETIANALLHHVCCLTSPPTRLSIDQDSALTSQVIKELLTSLECTMKIISPWNHGSSKAERQIKTIGNMINKHLTQKGASWPLYAAVSAYAMNTFASTALQGLSPELRHQYGMLFNHHGQVISGLKNMDLFLSIDLPKIEDIAHVPPPFPDCDNWAAPHKSNKNHHVYFSVHGFGRDNHGPMTELNTNTSAYLAEAIHITVCNQYKNKYIKLLERIETIKRNILHIKLKK